MLRASTAGICRCHDSNRKQAAKGWASREAGETTQYIKGMKIRIDQSNDGKMTSTVMDAGGKQMIMLNHEKKEADVYDMAKIGESLAKIPISDIKASVTPTGADASDRRFHAAPCTT